MELTHAHLRYLLVIYELSLDAPAVSSTQVARMLGVKKPSVARMLKNLRERGLAEKERYGKIALTAAGMETARQYRGRLRRIAAWFPHMGLELDREETLAAAGALLMALPDRCLPAEEAGTSRDPAAG